jgi:hypothetical protein
MLRSFKTPANHPVSGLPLLAGISNRQPLTANRYPLTA